MCFYIFCFPANCEKTLDLLYEKAGGITFVTIEESVVFDERAKTHLTFRAKATGVEPTDALLSQVEPGKGYNARDLSTIFYRWYGDMFKTTVYSQYAVLETAHQIVAKTKPKGSAYNDLHDMIGLSDAKKIIGEALDFYKAQKLFKERGFDQSRPSMHMVFTGNPGTAKTTVARLFASIMKENGLLPNGKLYEVGRADLVDRFLGGTAPRVKKAFLKARGGVLFIDEAYSLVEERDGLYGDEAINTIVQEMENMRDEVVVIFSGYTDQMEGFLKKIRVCDLESHFMSHLQIIMLRSCSQFWNS